MQVNKVMPSDFPGGTKTVQIITPVDMKRM
jgi:hypothetical protein